MEHSLCPLVDLVKSGSCISLFLCESVWTCVSLFRVKKYKMMTSAKERHKLEETCIVASRERGHCGKAYGGGQNSAHLL